MIMTFSRVDRLMRQLFEVLDLNLEEKYMKEFWIKAETDIRNKKENRHWLSPNTLRLMVFLCFVLFCFVLFCFVLFCFVLFCFVLFCFVLFCFVLFCFVLFCFVLFCFVLFCFVL